MNLTRPLAAVLAAFFVVALAACKPATLVMDTAAVGTVLANLDDRYESVTETVARNWETFSPDEQAQLQRVDESLQGLSDEMHGLMDKHGGLGEVLVRAETVATLYGQARESYITAHEIIKDRMDDLPPGDRAALERYDRMAVRLDERMESLLSAPDGTDVTQEVTDALSLAATAARLVGAAL